MPPSCFMTFNEDTMRKQFVWSLICAVVIPVAASAQQSVEFGALFGLYAPTGTYHHEATYFRVGTPERPDQNRGGAWGVEGRFWMNPRVGLQLQGVTSSAGQPTVYTPAGISYGSSAYVTSLTAQAAYVLTPESCGNRLWLTAGGGVIRHSGSSYDPYGSPMNAAGALGLGSAIRLPHGLAASFGISSLLYNWKISDGRGVYQRGFETDLLMHAGMTWNVR